MARFSLTFISFFCNLIIGYSQTGILYRQTLLKNQVKEVKIYSNDSVKSELVTQHFIDDSGRIYKTLHLFYSENKTDTTYSEYFKYDSLNRETEYNIRYPSAKSNSNLRRQLVYQSDKSMLELLITNKDTIKRLISYKKKGHISKNYCNGELFAKSILRGNKQIIKYKWENHHRKNAISPKSVAYYLDSAKNIIKSISIYKKTNTTNYNQVVIQYSYNQQNECMRSCHKHSDNTVEPRCFSYLYIRKEN